MDVDLRHHVAAFFTASLGVIVVAFLALKKLRLRWRFISLGLVVLALVIASYQLILRYLAQQSQALEQRLQAQMEWVLVFSRDLEAGSTLHLGDLQQRKFPPGYISDDWLRPNDAMAVVGSTVENFVSAGEPVILGHLGKARRVSFSDTLAEDEYAVTANLSIEQGHHGLLAVGNRVSLIGAGLHDSQPLMLHDIEVLALDNQSGAYQEQQLAVTATFRLQAQQAFVFEQLRRTGFALWLQHPEASYKQPAAPIKPHLFVISKQGVLR